MKGIHTVAGRSDWNGGLRILKRSSLLRGVSVCLLGWIFVGWWGNGHANDLLLRCAVTSLDKILDFHEPTGIRGTVQFIDIEGQTLWLNWEQRSDDRPLFKSGWWAVPGKPMLAVHPADTRQFEALQRIPRGTRLELIIQLDEEGKRRILSYKDLSLPPEVPL
ncbi:MAG: hypothetical protein D6704_04965 [Nitrospirae bacterium]|nr:MAG: hypothetical protein D6704_04965 [Nitrospirota bacterium]